MTSSAKTTELPAITAAPPRAIRFIVGLPGSDGTAGADTTPPLRALSNGAGTDDQRVGYASAGRPA